MAVYINTLIGGDITVGSGGSPAPATRATTIITTEEDGAQEFLIEGTLDQQWMIDNGFFVDENVEAEIDAHWEKNIISIDIGSAVTIIGEYTFYKSGLTSIVIPNNITNIQERAFEESDIVNFIIDNSNITINSLAFHNLQEKEYNQNFHLKNYYR